MVQSAQPLHVCSDVPTLVLRVHLILHHVLVQGHKKC